VEDVVDADDLFPVGGVGDPLVDMRGGREGGRERGREYPSGSRNARREGGTREYPSVSRNDRREGGREKGRGGGRTLCGARGRL